MKNILRVYKKYTSLLFRISLGILLMCYLLLFVSELSVKAADALNGSICFGLRYVLAKLTGWLPVSLGEWVIYALPTVLLFFVLYVWLACPTKEKRLRFVSSVLALILCVCSLHILTLGIAYRTTRLDDKLGLVRQGATAEELLEIATDLKTEAEALLPEIDFDETGSSVMPYDLNTLSEKICEAYETLQADTDAVHTYQSRIKGITASEFMSYARLLGVYSFYTGESNLNTEYPTYNDPFTTAHEFAHQRGIIREDEANFIAFLVCLRSEDAYVRYSGYANLLVYFLNAYYKAVDKDTYYAFLSTVDERILGEYISESEFSEKYEDTSFGRASQAFNDAYLKFNGTEGAVSYGFVVDLAVAYFKAR